MLISKLVGGCCNIRSTFSFSVDVRLTFGLVRLNFRYFNTQYRVHFRPKETNAITISAEVGIMLFGYDRTCIITDVSFFRSEHWRLAKAIANLSPSTTAKLKYKGTLNISAQKPQ